MRRSAKKQSTGRSVAPPAAQSATSTMELPDVLWDRIACRAYALWRERGCRNGYALQDWLDAEATIMGEFHETRE
jgi:hypothetical protein